MSDKPYASGQIAERVSSSADAPKSRRRAMVTLVRSGEVTHFGRSLGAAEAKALKKTGRRAVRPSVKPERTPAGKD
jgi:hypothetical protein